MSIILASKSPRRQELLHLLLPDFAVETADIDETMDPSLPQQTEVARVCALKAEKIAALHPQAVVIAADTVVCCEGQTLGKPKDARDAARMLHLLSGRKHEVLTGVCVRRGGVVCTEVVRSELQFRQLSDTEISAYIQTGEPMDKAGAYGIQGKASVFVSHLDGDYFAVMGLPVCALAQMLRKFGVQILGQ